MIQEQISEELNHELKANKSHAQILIETNPFKTIEDARKVMEDFGVQIIETKYLSANWVLFKLNIKDIRSISLKIIEMGFSNIKGVNTLK
jgi:hypothetical protein